MPRPKRARNICFDPEITYFKPRGVPMSELEQMDISIDELEAIRLKYLEDNNNEDGAKQMHISSSTFQRLIVSGIKKLTESLTKGKAIKIHKSINII